MVIWLNNNYALDNYYKNYPRFKFFKPAIMILSKRLLNIIKSKYKFDNRVSIVL